MICCCLPTYGPLLAKDSIFVSSGRLYSKLINKARTFYTNRESSEGRSASRKELGFRSFVRCHNDSSDREVEEIALTHAAEGFKSGEQHAAGGAFPMSAISIESTVEMV